MNPVQILEWAGTLIDLVQKNGNVIADAVRAYNSIANIFAKDPSTVTQQMLDNVIAENVAKHDIIHGKQLDPETA